MHLAPPSLQPRAHFTDLLEAIWWPVVDSIARGQLWTALRKFSIDASPVDGLVRGDPVECGVVEPDACLAVAPLVSAADHLYRIA